jgi:hypothetical protein
MKEIYVDKRLLIEALRELIEITVENGDFSPLRALLQSNQQVTFRYKYRKMIERHSGRPLHVGSLLEAAELCLGAQEFLMDQIMMPGSGVECSSEGFYFQKGECEITIKRL